MTLFALRKQLSIILIASLILSLFSAARPWHSQTVQAAAVPSLTTAVQSGEESEPTSQAYDIQLHDGDSLLISDTEQFTGWSNTTPATSQAVHGNQSGLWTNPATAISTPKFTVPWKSYQQIEFWLYSEQASNKKVYLIIDTNIAETPAFDYFLTSFQVNWTGWKKVELPFSQFIKSTPQADFDNFNKIMFHPNWYTATDPVPDPTDKIYIDGLALGDKIVLPPLQPVIASPPAGLYAETKTVSLSVSNPGAQILYKFEGEDDLAYRIYTEPLSVMESKTIITKAVHEGEHSDIVSHTYQIDLSSSSSVPISNMEQFTGWSNTTSTTLHAVMGERSGLWTDPTKAINVQKFPAEWKKYDQVEFWLYSEQASNKKVYFIIDTNITATAGFDYFMTSFFVDWTGWKKIEIPYTKFLNSTGSADFDNFNQIIIHPNWYVNSDPVPNPSDKLYFDGLALTKNVVQPSINVIHQSALPDSTVNYKVSLKNIGTEATAYQLVEGTPFGAGYTTTFDSVTDLITVGDEAEIDISVKVPTNAAAGDTAQGVYYVRPVKGGKEIKLELNVAIGATRVPTKWHPYIMTTPSGLEAAKDKIETYKWASDYLEAIKAKADEWVNKTIYYPTKPAGQTFWFVCGDVTLSYNYDSPDQHLCPTDGKLYSGDQIDAGWRFTTHTMNTEAARTLGIAYALTGEEKYAAKAKEILVQYSKLYPSFPVQAQYGKLFYQTLDEAVQMIQLVQAYDLIYPSGLLTDKESYGIEQNLFAASARTLQGYDVGKSNWQTWHNAAIGAIGAALEDKTLMDHSVLGRSGFNFQMDNSVLSDGFWYEGAIGYHFYSQMALFAHAQSLKNMGYDLFANANLKKTYDATLKYAYPDLGIINSNDSSKYPTNLSAPGRVVPIDYEGVYGEYNDPIYGALLSKLYNELGRPRGGHILPGNANSGLVGEQAVFYGMPEITNAGVLPSESINFEGLGHSIIRVGSGNDQLFALMDYGLHGGYHGHPDKLHLDIFGEGVRLAPDLGIPLYSNSMYEKYYKKTFSHNTVVVDGKTQTIPPSNAETYEPTKMYLPSERFGIMTNSSVKANVNMNTFERTVAVTPDYMIDLFTVDSNAERTYDWVMRGLGSFETEADMENMTEPLGTEDAYPYFRNGKEVQISGVWEGAWKTPAGKGLRLFSVPGSASSPMTMIVGESIGPANDTNAYTPTVVSRVKAKHAQFVSVLEPYSGTSKIESVSRYDDHTIEVKLLDGRKHLFFYQSDSAVAGELQYAWIEGRNYNSEDVVMDSSLVGTDVDISLNDVAGVERITAVLYAPGVTKVTLNGEEVEFAYDNGYLTIESEVGSEPEPTPAPTSTPTPAPTSTSVIDSTPTATPISTVKPEPTPTATPTSIPAPVIKDIGAHWASQDIKNAVQAGIVKGFGDGTFRPNEPVSREQFIVMIINALKPNEISVGDTEFADSHLIARWSEKAVKQAVEMGLISGYADGSFRPQQSLNRAQLAVMIAKALGIESVDTRNPGFSDTNTIPLWALPAATHLEELGIIIGRTGNRFAANEEVTRAEAVTVILRLLKYKEKLVDK